jgi:hypothetical protein
MLMCPRCAPLPLLLTLKCQTMAPTLAPIGHAVPPKSEVGQAAAVRSVRS